MIRVDGIDDLRGAFKRLDKLSRLPASGVRVLGFTLRDQTRERFNTKTGPGGEGWAPYAVSTLERKLAEGEEPDLLSVTRRLRRSFKVEAKTGSGQMGTDVEYARAHQDGTKRIPAREFLGIDGDNLAELDDRLQTWGEFFMEGLVQ